MGVNDGFAYIPDPVLPLRTTIALCSILGIDSRCSVNSFLLTSLMWNLRPHPGQCLKNSIRETLCPNYLDRVENIKFPLVNFRRENIQSLSFSASRISCGCWSGFTVWNVLMILPCSSIRNVTRLAMFDLSLRTP